MRTTGTPEELERKRMRAVELFLQGEKPEDICKFLGVSKGALYSWRRTYLQGGAEALKAKQKTRSRKLTQAQLNGLETELKKGSVAHGWANEIWTGERVAALIRKLFNIQYTPDHVRVLLREALQWTSQKPERKGRERDEEEIQRWRTEEFPLIKKRPRARRAHSVSR